MNLRAVKGMKDILPDEISKWHRLESAFRQRVEHGADRPIEPQCDFVKMRRVERFRDAVDAGKHLRESCRILLRGKRHLTEAVRAQQ